MNQYPLWKYLLILAVVVVGALYALPNVFGESPAIQISTPHGGKIEASVLTRVEDALRQAGVPYEAASIDQFGGKIRFADTDTQLRAKEIASRTLGDRYTVALNLLPATPSWLSALGARPMYLGLDLRGGVYFLMQVDMPGAIKQTYDRYTEDVRRALQDQRVRYTSVERSAQGITVNFPDLPQRDAGRDALAKALPEMSVNAQGDSVLLQMTPAALTEKRKFALDQNITALRRRVNELGVAEPVIQQQGQDRIVVQLPGVQDIARAKEIIGRTATLEVKMVDDEHDVNAAAAGRVPPGDRLYRMRDGRPILLKNPVIYSGDNIIDAAAGFDSQMGTPVVHITLDARGTDRNERVTRDNVGKRMAVVYIEIRSETKRDAQGQPVVGPDGKPERVRKRVEEVITAPTIQEPLGKRFQITGLASIQEARDLALLLRAGALAAPVDIIEERTVGPSLGADNIQRGFDSTLYGFVAIAVFMMIYYHVIFGAVATAALAINLVLLISVLSMLQATLTLPGIAGIALTVGMAIDANVLIYERIREELRNRNTPHAAIHGGYDRAWNTILDSNVTTLIAGLALFSLGSGPVRGFAVTLCIGIVTSMFSAVMVSRAMVNLIYGRRRRLSSLKI